MFLRLAVFSPLKRLMWRWFEKKFQPNRSEGKKVTAIWKWVLKKWDLNRQPTGTGLHRLPLNQWWGMSDAHDQKKKKI